MSAAERLRAAIDKLEALRRAGSAGMDEWKLFTVSSGIRSSADYSWIVFDDGDETSRYRIAEKQNWGAPADMEMIVALHRTIDAQIVILKMALVRKVAKFGEYVFAAEAVALADAILGDAS